MHARNAHIGTRIEFDVYVGLQNDIETHTGVVTDMSYAHKRWFVGVTLDQPNDRTGPAVALPEDWEVRPAA